MQSLAAVGAHIGYIGAATKIASPEQRKRDAARPAAAGATRRPAGGGWCWRVGPWGRAAAHFPLVTNETTLAAC